MSDVISFNTQKDIEQSFSEQKPIDIFSLVSENDPIFKTKSSEFDFGNPPYNANEFASTLRRVAKQEERNITTIALRAFRLYFKEEHNIEVKEEQD